MYGQPRSPPQPHQQQFQYTPALAPSQMQQGGGVPAWVQSQQYAQQQGQQQSNVGDAEYNRLLKNYKLAHERIEEQRQQMLEQERQNALLRKHISLLEGGDTGVSVVGGNAQGGGGGTTVDDFTIKNSSSGLERLINRWAADVVSDLLRSAPPAPVGSTHLALIPLAEAVYSDLASAGQGGPFMDGLSEQGFDYAGLGLVVQSWMRHLMSELISEGIINELLVTNSEEANRELTKLHDQLLSREPLVASVWRRQTFSAAVSSLDPSMSLALFTEHMPTLFPLLSPSPVLEPSLAKVLGASHNFSRMLHASRAPGGGGEGVYKAFVPAMGTQLDPTKIVLVKRCYRTERGEPERVGACLFPGLAKISMVEVPLENAVATLRLGHDDTTAGAGTGKKRRESTMVVVRRAEVICECALAASPSAMVHGSVTNGSVAGSDVARPGSSDLPNRPMSGSSGAPIRSPPPLQQQQGGTMSPPPLQMGVGAPSPGINGQQSHGGMVSPPPLQMHPSQQQQGQPQQQGYAQQHGYSQPQQYSPGMQQQGYAQHQPYPQHQHQMSPPPHQAQGPPPLNLT